LYRHCEKVLLEWPGLGDVPPRPDVGSLDDLVRLVLAHMERPVHLVAQSMGGVVAMLAALARPTAIERMVLVATSGGIDLTPFGLADWRPEYARDYPDAAPWIRHVRIDLTDRLSSIDKPVLLLWGDEDPISPVRVGERLKALLPKSELIVVRGGDHMVARDRADAVAPLVDRHLFGG
jgi:poly(3-hydroxyoctanoate) depolymerase